MVFQFVKNYLFSSRAGAVVKLISWVSILGIGISVAAMLVVLNVMNGFNAAIHKRLLSIDPHISISVDTPNKAKELISSWQSFSVLKEAESYLVTEEDVIFRTVDALFSGAIARGVPEENFNLMKKKLFVQSDDPEQDWYLGDNEVAVGEDLARSLGIYLEDELTMIQPESLLLPADEIPKYEKLKVKAIFRSNVADMDSKYILYPRGKSFLSFNDSMSVKSLIHVYLKNKDVLPQAEKYLKDKNINYRSWKDKNSSYLYALRMEKISMGSFLGLTIVIACFTILMVLSLVISQKRKDIALLQTMGLGPKETKRLFTLFGFQLGAMGAIGGFVLGIVICILVEHFGILELPKEIYYDYKIPVKIDYFLSFSILGASLLLSYLSSLVPAHLGAKMQIARILRPGVES
jgi:lipoprotein-releasing system permease protein